jgi:putative DNA primase/helicase
MSSDPDLIKLMEDVVFDLLGSPNGEADRQNRADLRFGKRGSMSVNLLKGTWYSHEDGQGGGVIDLIKREMDFTEASDALAWAEREGYWVNGRATNGSGKTKLGPIVATYDYTDENGLPLFQVVRYDKPQKDFRQRRPDGHGGWNWNVKGVHGVPYHLPRVIEAIAKQQIIYVCEGEKDCNNLIGRGLTATTNPGGANKWRDVLTPHFRGADVVVIADNDKAGKTHAADVAQKLTGTAKRIRLLDLASVWPECKPKGDVSDWLDAGHNVEKLCTVVAQLPDWRSQSASARLGVMDAGDDITLPPPRAWLHGNIFCREFLSSLFGDGGVGKTALRYAQ